MTRARWLLGDDEPRPVAVTVKERDALLIFRELPFAAKRLALADLRRLARDARKIAATNAGGEPV